MRNWLRLWPIIFVKVGTMWASPPTKCRRKLTATLASFGKGGGTAKPWRRIGNEIRNFRSETNVGRLDHKPPKTCPYLTERWGQRSLPELYFYSVIRRGRRPRRPEKQFRIRRIFTPLSETARAMVSRFKSWKSREGEGKIGVPKTVDKSPF